MRTMLLLAAFWFAQSPAAGAGNKFDLKCAGSGNAINGAQKASGTQTRTLHVDLESNQYCADSCATVLTIAHVDPVRITFLAIDNHGGALNLFRGNEAVDRRNGAYEFSIMDAASLRYVAMTGKCEPAPFTPFPKTKF